MLWFKRKYIAILGALLIAGCGFEPVYQENKTGPNVGSFALIEATNPIEFAYRERLRRRLGDPSTNTAFLIVSKISLEDRGVAVTQAREITRVRVEGQAIAQIVDQQSGNVVSTESVAGVTGYDATASAFATRSAKNAAEERLATDLAERIAARILAKSKDLTIDGS